MTRAHLFIATHHKSGTVWLLTTFRRLAKSNGFAFVHLNADEVGWTIRPDKLEYFESQRAIVEEGSELPAVFADFHSAIPDLTRCIEERGARGLHVVRDPRDMLLSAARFHLVSGESWLHVPDPAFGGLSYQQKLDSYEQIEDRIRFEMDQHMGRVIGEMHRFDRQGIFVDVRYEDLMVDTEMVLWRKLCSGLGLVSEEIDRAGDAFWRSSLFGDRSARDLEVGKKHVFDSRPGQWRRLMTPGLLEEIQDRFGEEIVGLGYGLGEPTDLVGAN